MSTPLNILFDHVQETYNPTHWEYRRVQNLEARLYQRLEALDRALVEQFLDALSDRQLMDQQAFFSLGFQTALSLLSP